MKRFEREEEAEELTGQVEVVVGAAGAGAYVEAGGSATHLPPSLPQLKTSWSSARSSESVPGLGVLGRTLHAAVSKQLRKSRIADIHMLISSDDRCGGTHSPSVSGPIAPPAENTYRNGRGERPGVRSGCPSDGIATRSDVRKSFESPQS
jgi:hypothetical protein